MTLFFAALLITQEPPDLPPLPNPFSVELDIAEPVKEKIPLDSLILTGSVFNPFGFGFRAAQGFGANVLEADAAIDRISDFAGMGDLVTGHSRLAWTRLLTRSWSRLDVEYRISRRGNLLQQTRGGTLTLALPFDLILDCPVHSTELVDFQNHRSFGFAPEVSWSFRFLGRNRFRTAYFFQPAFRSFLDFSLDDQIDLNSLFFIRPGIQYQLPENTVAGRLLFGSVVKSMAFTAEFIYNSRIALRYDSLYFNQLFFEIAPRLGPARFRLGTILAIGFPGLEVRYERAAVDSFISWGDTDRDLLLEPHNHHVRREAVSVRYWYCWKGIKNSFRLGYEKNLPALDLVPVWILADSVSLAFSRFTLDASGSWTDSRPFDGRALAPFFVLSSRLNYRLGIFTFFFGVDNILDKKYESLPYRFSPGRRFALGATLARPV